MRAGEQTQPFELAHHAANRGGRKAEAGELRDRLRPDRRAAGEIAVDDRTKNIARAVGQFGDGGRGHRSDLGRIDWRKKG
jgi:hypothetical protein